MFIWDQIGIEQGLYWDLLRDYLGFRVQGFVILPPNDGESHEKNVDRPLC